MRKDKKVLTEEIESIEKDFWNVDCLIRMMKEMIFNNSWEIREGDTDMVCEVLAEKSGRLCKKVEGLKEKL